MPPLCELCRAFAGQRDSGPFPHDGLQRKEQVTRRAGGWEKFECRECGATWERTTNGHALAVWHLTAV